MFHSENGPKERRASTAEPFRSLADKPSLQSRAAPWGRVVHQPPCSLAKVGGVFLSATVDRSVLENAGQNRRAANLTMAKIIEFYIPTRFQKKAVWVPPQERGKVIEFCTQVKKSA